MQALTMHEISIVKDWIYAINYKYNSLCKINRLTNEIKQVHSFMMDGERLQYNYATEFYNHIWATEALIFVINTFTNHLLIYNTDLSLIANIVLLEKPENMSIIGINSNVLYLYVVSLGTIIGMNIKTKKDRRYSVPKKYVGKINSMGIKIIDESFWLTGYMGNTIIEIAIENGEMYEHKINSIKGDICLCEKNENSFWLCTQHQIIEWNKADNMIKQILHFPCEIEPNNLIMPFYYSCVKNGCLWFFPLKGKVILKLDIQSRKIDIYTQKRDKEKCKKTFGYLDIDNMENVIYGIDSNMNNISLKLNNGETTNIVFLIDDSLLEKVKKQFYRYNTCLNERMFDVFELLEDTNKTDLLVIEGNVGNLIYNCCRH